MGALKVPPGHPSTVDDEGELSSTVGEGKWVDVVEVPLWPGSGKVPAFLRGRPLSAEEAACPPPLNIVILIVGSRGDVQPFIALGKALVADGHNVRIGTHEVFRNFVGDAGLGFYPIGGDPAELMAYMTKNPGLIPSMESIREGDITRKRTMIREMLMGCWHACTRPSDDGSETPFTADAIISNPVCFAHEHCAERLNIPLHIFFTMPWSPTKAFPHPLANLSYSNANKPKRKNYLSYSAVETLTWQGLGDIINAFRRKLDLSTIPLASFLGPTLLSTLKVPHTYCWSPALIPKPEDWGDHIDICGFFFLQLGSNYTPPDDLRNFLDAGPPPIYIGFGSVHVEDPGAFTKVILEGVAKTPGVRVLISQGWGKLSAEKAPSNVFFMGNCPHDWLFQRVAGVVCHGGAGTVAAAMRCGKPIFVVPFFGDQPFWGAMVHRAGAGPAPVHHRKLTAESLSEALQYCLREETAVAAKELGRKVAAEDGVAEGVRSFYRHLPLNAMRCDVDGRHKAQVYLPKHAIKACRGCTTAFLNARSTRRMVHLSAHPWRTKAYPTSTLTMPMSPLTGMSRGLERLAGDLVDGAGLLASGAAAFCNDEATLASAVRETARGGISMVECVANLPAVLVEGLGVGLWNTSARLEGTRESSIKGRPATSLLHGLRRGSWYFAAGVLLGAADVVVKPAQHVHRQGASGLASGLVIGATSLATKPVAGALCLVSMPLSGVRSAWRHRNKTRRLVFVPRAQANL